jgi:hypothetical protein
VNVARLFEELPFEAGAVVMECGSVADRRFVVTSGRSAIAP